MSPRVISDHLEEVSCPCQGGTPPHLAFQAPTRRYWRCPTCDLIFFSPRPTRTAITTFYRENYDDIFGKLESSPDRLPVFQSVLGHLSEYRLPPGRLLDIGCGHGDFAALCAAKGWTCFGVELSRDAAAQATRRGITMLPNDWLDNPSLTATSADRFDVITLINVLERVLDPVAVLHRAAGALSPNGLLLIRVTNGAFHVPLRKPIAWMGLRAQQAFDLFVYMPHVVDYYMRAVGLTPVSTRNSHPSHGPLVGSERLLRRLAWRVAGAGLRLIAQSAYWVTGGRTIWAPSFETIAKQACGPQVKL